ncbi:MAG: type II toxin-antitoxin system prevent-host-death family antitoxin [Novosphingobium sp.]
MGIEISITEFKAKCLELFDKLSRHEIESIEVTKRGRKIGRVVPIEDPPLQTLEEALAEYREWLKTKTISSTAIDPEFDLTKPVLDVEDLSAYQGRAFPDDE